MQMVKILYKSKIGCILKFLILKETFYTKHDMKKQQAINPTSFFVLTDIIAIDRLVSSSALFQYI